MPDQVLDNVLRIIPGTAYTAASGDIGGASGAITPTKGAKRLFVTCAFSAGGVLSKRIGGVNIPAKEGAALVAGAGYTFETTVSPADAPVSFRYSVDATILEFHVEESAQ
jgi:hypothetical protein